MIYIPKICGTCNGSVKALNLIYEIYEREIKKDNPKKIYIYKEILHNPKVIEELTNLGIMTIDTLDNVTSEDIVIIRCHGEGYNTYKYLEDKGIEYYDATCPNVARIHKLVYEKYQNGYEIILVGNHSHPEVIGTNGWCENEAIIIEKEEDIEKINSDNQKKYIICQTTFNKDLFLKIANSIKEKYSNLEIEVENTICNAVKNICKSSVEVVKKCDYMCVIGGKNSSNTKELFNEVSKYSESYMFSNILEFYKFIKDNNFTSEDDIGITGGASTPIKEIYNYKYLLTFILYYKDKLKEFIKGQSGINKGLLDNVINDNIKEVINDFCDLNQDGKYIRGTLIALGYNMASLNDQNYLNLAFAYEMFQTSVLVHDDIIDNAKYRRGKETIPRRICAKYLNDKSEKDYQKSVLALANSIGICIGDLGFYEANNLIIKNYKENINLANLLECYNNIIIKTIKGEILDVYLPFMGKYNLVEVCEKDILDIYELKTSWYTIIGPISLGLILGGRKLDKKLESILNKIGISFQIKDDILGIFSDIDTLGKSIYSDILEFKQTILYSHIINTPYKEEFLKIYGKKNLNKTNFAKIKELLIKSGSLDYAKDYLDNLYWEVINELDEIDMEDYFKDILKGLFVYINIREK